MLSLSMSKNILTIMLLTSILNFFGCKGKNEPEKTKEDAEFEQFLEQSKNSIDEFNNRKIYKEQAVFSTWWLEAEVNNGTPPSKT